MKKLFVGFVVFALILGSCVETGNKSTPEGNRSTVDIQAPPAKGEGMGAGNNAVRAAAIDPDLKTWAILLQKSKWGKQVADGKYTFLCPTEKIFQPGAHQLLSELKRPENQELLDRIMAKHLLSQQYSVSDLLLLDKVTTIDGQELLLDRQTMKINGVGFTKREIVTDHGNVIVIDDVLEYPEAELKESASRAMKNRSV